MATKTMTAVGTAQISTTSPKIGTGAGLFAGTGDRVTTPDSAEWAFGSGLFTVECWVKSTATNGFLVGQEETTGKFWGVTFSTSNTIGFGSVTPGGWETNFSITATNIADGNWHHVVVQRSATNGNSGDWQIYYDGTQGTKTLNVGSYNTGLTDMASVLMIGGTVDHVFENDLVGRIDEMRISKGVARYSSNFTPSTTAFTADANTNLLLHFDGTNGSTTFTDDSAAGTIYTLTAGNGSFTLTGEATTLHHQRTLTAVNGSYTLTGEAVTFAKGHGITATNGSYILTGKTVTFDRNIINMTAANGSYVLTGKTVTLSHARTLTASNGSYTLTGFAATLSHARTLTASNGSYTLTGEAATLKRSHILSPLNGIYALIGFAATPSHARFISPAQGSYTLTGEATTLAHARTISPLSGRYSLRGFYTSLNWDSDVSTRWTTQARNSSTFSRQNKNKSIWTNQGK